MGGPRGEWTFYLVVLRVKCTREERAREDILPFMTWPQMSHSISLPQLLVRHLKDLPEFKGR